MIKRAIKIQPKPQKTTTKVILSTIILLNIASQTASLHSMVITAGNGGVDTSCPDDTSLKLLAIRLKISHGQRIAFNLADYSSSPPEREFITKASDGQKRYGEFNLGSTCYMHANQNAENTYPFFVFIIARRTNVPNTQNCKLVKIITSKGLETCSGASRDLLTKAAKLGWHNGNLASIDGFSRIKIDGENEIDYFAGKVYSIANFGVNDINEDILEMMLLGGLDNPNIDDHIMQVDYTVLNNINEDVARNSFATEIDPTNMVPRLVKDDLPGYFLEPYTSGGSDETEKYAQMWFSGNSQSAFSLHSEFYIEKPNLILGGEVHSVVVSYKNWVISASANQRNLKEFEYKISVSRVGANLNIKVYRVEGGADTQRITLDYPDNGSNTGYLYFSLTTGRGILYYIDATNVRVKAHETLHVHRVGESRARQHATYQEDALLNSVFKTSNLEAPNRYAKVEFKTTAASADNKAGLRLLVISQALGVYPAFLVSSSTNAAARPRCYFDGYEQYNCISLALLSGPAETQAPTVRNGKTVVDLASGTVKSYCKVALSTAYCLIPKTGSGYISNLESSKIIAVYKRLLPIAEYDAHTGEQKKMGVEFQSNVGTRYFVSCDYSCKNNNGIA